MNAYNMKMQIFHKIKYDIVFFRPSDLIITLTNFVRDNFCPCFFNRSMKGLTYQISTERTSSTLSPLTLHDTTLLIRNKT